MRKAQTGKTQLGGRVQYPGFAGWPPFPSTRRTRRTKFTLTERSGSRQNIEGRGGGGVLRTRCLVGNGFKRLGQVHGGSSPQTARQTCPGNRRRGSGSVLLNNSAKRGPQDRGQSSSRRRPGQDGPRASVKAGREGTAAEDRAAPGPAGRLPPRGARVSPRTAAPEPPARPAPLYLAAAASARLGLCEAGAGVPGRGGRLLAGWEARPAGRERRRRGARHVLGLLAAGIHPTALGNVDARGAAHAGGSAADTLAGSRDPVSKRPARRLGAAACAVSSPPGRAAAASAGLPSGSAAAPFIAVRARRRRRRRGGGDGAGSAPRPPLRTCLSRGGSRRPSPLTSPRSPLPRRASGEFQGRRFALSGPESRQVPAARATPPSP